LRWLQARQADTTFCQTVSPPRELGVTCSISRAACVKRPPQYAQTWRSRAKTIERDSGARSSVPRTFQRGPSIAMIAAISSVERCPCRRLMPPCSTSRSAPSSQRTLPLA